MDRKEQFIGIGAELAAKHGLVNVTRRMVAKKARVTDALVTHHVGNNEDARKLYKARMKKLKLTEPTKEIIEAMGQAMRARGKRSGTVRKRSVREVKAIKKATLNGRTPIKKRVPTKAPPEVAPEVVAKAARMPKAPPPGVSAEA